MAKRVDMRRNLILAQIRTQHEEGMTELKEYDKTKGKRYGKAILKASTEKERIIDMADIPGEKDAAATHLEILTEVRAEKRINNRKN